MERQSYVYFESLVCGVDYLHLINFNDMLLENHVALTIKLCFMIFHHLFVYVYCPPRVR